MRFVLAVLMAVIAIPCVAQERIFHASAIDIEQNNRLTNIETRLAALEAPTVIPTARPAAPKKQITKAVVSPEVCPNCPAPVVQHAHPHPHPAPVVVRSQPAVVQSQSNYQPRWQNYDGLSFRQHAEQMHGINTSGMSDSQVGLLRDRDHDMYGGGHPAAMRNRSAQSYSNYAVPAQSGCPGGVCPTGASQYQSSRSGGLLGFGILGRRR